MTLYLGELKGLAKPDASVIAASITASASLNGFSVLRSLYRSVALPHPMPIAPAQSPVAGATRQKPLLTWK